MLERTAQLILAGLLSVTVSIVGIRWPDTPEPTKGTATTQEVSVERLQIALKPLPPTTTTPPSTTTTQAPAEASPVPSQGIPADTSQRCPEYENLFREYGLRPIQVFSYLAWRESRCNPLAVNGRWDKAGRLTWTLNRDGSVDRGLLQINSSWKTLTASICGTRPGDLDALFDVDCNLRVARRLLGDGSGLTNWGLKHYEP